MSETFSGEGEGNSKSFGIPGGANLFQKLISSIWRVPNLSGKIYDKIEEIMLLFYQTSSEKVI